MHSHPVQPAPTPRQPSGSGFWRRLAHAMPPARPQPPALPADWDELDLDQRVRRMGEW